MARIPISPQPERIAIVYDRLNSWGGAERVVQSLLQIYPRAVLFTSVYDPKRAGWIGSTPVKTTFLQHWSWLRNRHRWLGWLMPFAFETLDLAGYDLVISVSSEAAKAVITKPEQLHVCYLLTPTRYLWSHEQEYRDTVPVFFRPGVHMVQNLLKKWDRVAAQRPDVLLAISHLVAKRSEHFYQRKCQAVLYPGFFPLPEKDHSSMRVPEKFLFTWGRHVAYKQFDVVIQAATALHAELIIAGEGPETKHLTKMAQKNVHFVGRISDSELAYYLQNAECAIFPQLEDFGIAPLEALSQGCPVIVHRKSGVTERLQEGKDGIFIDQTTAKELQAAIRKIEQKTWRRLDIQSRAREYAVETFKVTWKKKIQMLWEQHQQHLKGNL